MLFTRDILWIKRHEVVESSETEKIFHPNRNSNRAIINIRKKTDFKKRWGDFILIKESVYQDNIYTPNRTQKIHMKKMGKINRKFWNIVLGNFNTLLKIVVKYTVNLQGPRSAQQH